MATKGRQGRPFTEGKTTSPGCCSGACFEQGDCHDIELWTSWTTNQEVSVTLKEVSQDLKTPLGPKSLLGLLSLLLRCLLLRCG